MKDETQLEIQVHKPEPQSASVVLGTHIETIDSTSSLLKPSPYAFTPTNFSRLVKRVDRYKKKMKLFIEYLGLFIDMDISVH
ncbi:hypothetical protein R3W88_024435 [Solanum pinnatisectum]|uniref:Uncharacterized protein n=1 Tax=Solanum pinnatisectum TaxID=50273 RepID=A0AAV9M224_9SOLN|nr:hypothetical protein R3W88_024435 [Solanum pinnatisectum]